MPEDLRLTVTGMTCGGCENAVRRALSQLDGVSDVTASHADNAVTLRYDPARIDRDQITRKIAAVGYRVSS